MAWRPGWVAALATVVALAGCNDDRPPEKSSAGEPCFAQHVCEAGLTCWGPTGSTMTCRGPGVAGEPCWSDDSFGCANGFVCSDRTCIVPGTGEDGDRCSYNVDCGGGTICNWTTSPYVCTPPALVREPCEIDTDCASGLYCDGGWKGVCECPACAAGLVCGSAGCILPGSVPLSGACGYNINCEEGLVCVWAERPFVCQPPRELGEWCGHPTDCASGLICHSGATCRPPCVSDDSCSGGDVCVGEECQPPSGVGGECHEAADCVSGLVCYFSGDCRDPGVEGAFCLLSSDCREDLWCHSMGCAPRLLEGEPCPFNIVVGDPCYPPLACVLSRARISEPEGRAPCDSLRVRPVCPASPSVRLCTRPATPDAPPASTASSPVRAAMPASRSLGRARYRTPGRG